MRIKAIPSLLKAAAVGWMDANAARVAAALAYYTLLSMAPLVVLCIAIAGFVFGESAARQHLVDQTGALVGPQAGGALTAVVANAHQSQSGGIVSSIISIAVLLFGASAVFGELQEALNTIWGVKPKPGRGILQIVRERLFSFSMVISLAFLLLVSLIVSTVLSTVGTFMSEKLPGGEALWFILNTVISLGVTAALFATIFKVVPDVEVRWRDVWVGALFTAVLFSLGKLLLAWYLGTSTIASSYGAAGSVVALVVWVYYSAQLVFLGAEFTQAYARKFGGTIEPSKNAVPIGQDSQETQDTQAAARA
jgi:membrane protein